MKRYRDQTPAIEPPERKLPLVQRILCAVVIFLLIAGVVWISVWADYHQLQ